VTFESPLGQPFFFTFSPSLTGHTTLLLTFFPLDPQFLLLLMQDVETFYARDIEYNLQPSQIVRTNLEDIKFGTVFTDHMLLAEHADGQGWTRPLVQPFGYIPMHPAAQVLHYGMTCFEGMKAYRGADGTPRLFRPEMNMNRLARSARRLQLAPFDPQQLLECIKALIKVDSGWLPSNEGHSLYLRPFLFSSAHVLGVAKATRTTLSIIMSPVGPYFPSGMRPISLFVEERATRAWPGGVGQYKIGGNYAPTIQPQVQAAAIHGAQQVVYTFNSDGSSDSSDDAVFEECGAMNIFFLIEKSKQINKNVDSSFSISSSTASNNSEKRYELVTPSLDRGTILPGITRDSILSLAREWDEFEVSERLITIREIRQAASEGRLCEVFGSGTACIVQPVGALVRGNGEMWQPSVSDPADPRALAPRLQRALMDIQYGRVPNHPWSIAIE
jgi:branched-chain amino acid aminotransferase